MKDKDIAIIVGLAIFSAILSFIIASKVISTPANREQHIPIAPVISDEFTQPSTTYFNSSSVDPTQLIQIGNGTNTNPFSNAQ